MFYADIGTRPEIVETAYRTNETDGRIISYDPGAIFPVQRTEHGNIADRVCRVVARYRTFSDASLSYEDFVSTGLLLPNGTILAERSAVPDTRPFTLAVFTGDDPTEYAISYRLDTIIVDFEFGGGIEFPVDRVATDNPWAVILRGADFEVRGALSRRSCALPPLVFARPDMCAVDSSVFIIGFPLPAVKALDKDGSRLHGLLVDADRAHRRCPVDRAGVEFARMFRGGHEKIVSVGQVWPGNGACVRDHTANATRGLLGAPVFVTRGDAVYLFGMHVGTPDHRRPPAAFPECAPDTFTDAEFVAAFYNEPPFDAPPDTPNKLIDFSIAAMTRDTLKIAGVAEY